MGVDRSPDPPAKRGGNKRTVDVREAVNGVMYILSTGCRWAALPKDLPPRGTVIERKLRPLRKWLDSMASVMREARALEDTRPGLPSPAKRIHAPPKQIAPPSGELWAPPERPKRNDLDDEIPF